MLRKKVLLVEDDDLFRSAVKNILLKKFDVFEAADGQIARDLYAINDMDLILSDIQMPNLSGVELLDWVKKNKPCPFILMTGFSHILETQQAHELGAGGFLAKPFKEQELMNKIQSLLITEDESEADLDHQFISLAIDDFVAEKLMDYGIFIRMSPSKFIKVAQKGGKLTADQIAVFKTRGVTQLHVRKEDFAKLVDFNPIQRTDNINKLSLMWQISELIMSQSLVAGVNEELFKEAQHYLISTLDALADDQDTHALLVFFTKHVSKTYGRHLAITVYAVMMAQQMAWPSPQALFRLCFAGLFHGAHSMGGMDLLRRLQAAPPEVLQVASQYQENILAQGAAAKIHPFTRILSVAEVFYEYTSLSPQNISARTAQVALDAMRVHHASPVDSKSFEALCAVVVGDKEKATA